MPFTGTNKKILIRRPFGAAAWMCVCALACSLLFPQTLAAVEFPGAIDYQTIVSRADLIYNSPVSNPIEGHPIGNGVMGTTVWTTPGAIEFQINRNDVFAVDNTHGRLFNYKDNTTDYCSGCARISVNVGSQAFDGTGFSQRLSLYDAEDLIQGNGVSARTFVTADNVLMLEIDDQRATPQPLQVDVSMWRAPTVTNGTHTAAYGFQTEPDTVTLSQQFTENDYYCGSAVAVQVAGAGGVVQTSDRSRRITVPAASGKRLIQISSAASWDHTANLAAEANANLAANAGKTYDALRSEHAASWNELWSRSSVNLSSTDGLAQQAERQRNLQLYYMASSSRGAVPPKWNGSIFAVNGDARTWGSQYWVWTTESSYYPLYAADAVELTNPFYSMYVGQLPAAKEAARQRWGANGAFYPETAPFNGPVVLPEDVAEEFRRYLYGEISLSQMSEAAKAACRFEGHLFETVYDARVAQYSWISHVASSGSELAAQAWLRYRYTGDTDFLQTSAYPLLRESVEFYRSLAKKGADGLYHFEGLNQHEDFWGVKDGIMDLAAIRGTAPLAIRASEILGVDADLRVQWQEFLDNLTPYTMGSDPQSQALTGGVLANDVWSAGHLGDVNGQHNPEDVWLYTVFPFEAWTLETRSAAEDAIVQKTVDLAPRIAAVLGGSTLNTAIRSPIAVARAGRSDLLPAVLQKYSAAFSPLANGMSMFEGTDAQSTEQLGIISATVQEALLQSMSPLPGEQEILNVFPAWPLEWDAEFSLLARGGFFVRSRCDSGIIDYVQIESRLGETCFLRNPWGKTVNIYQLDGPAWQLDGEVLQFDTIVGKQYLMSPISAYVPISTPVALQNATATYSLTDYGWTGISASIDGVDGPTALGFHTYDHSDANQTGVWETVSDAGGTSWTFNISNARIYRYPGDPDENYATRRFRLSYTTADRDTFADGLQSGGDVDADWTVIAPTSASGTETTATINGDNSISWTAPDPDYTADMKTVTWDSAVSGITGFRLELLNDDGGYLGWGNSTLWATVITEFSVSSVTIPGDANHDLVVDGDDAAILAANWLGPGGWDQGDFNGDGIVNDIDATIMASNWNWQPGNSGTNVPEPGTVALALAGLLTLLADYKSNPGSDHE